MSTSHHASDDTPLRGCRAGRPIDLVGLQPIAERFWAKVAKGAPDDCWPWTAGFVARSARYGAFRIGNATFRAHRIAYELLVCPIPAGMTLDHLCRNTWCVNPGHLEPVTNRENILRGTSPSAVCATRTHCPQGHEYTPENTYVYPNHRLCKTCVRDHKRAARSRQAALRVA